MRIHNATVGVYLDNPNTCNGVVATSLLRSLKLPVGGCVSAFREGVTISENRRQVSCSARLRTSEQISALRSTHTDAWSLHLQLDYVPFYDGVRSLLTSAELA